MPEPKAELRLKLKGESEEGFAGWWVAGGSQYPSLGVGVIIVCSPEAAKRLAHGLSPQEAGELGYQLHQLFDHVLEAHFQPRSTGWRLN